MELAQLDFWDEPTTAVAVVRQPSGVATVSGGGSIILVTAAPKKLDVMPSEWRAKALQKRDFCRAVIDYQERYRCSQEAAVTTIAAAQADQFPELAKRGLLNYANFRSWTGKIKVAKGKFDWSNTEALADDYGWGQKSERKGDSRYWVIFWALYLNQNTLSVKRCFQMAGAAGRRIDPFMALPSIAQVQYQVANVDKRALYTSRRGETWVENNMITYIDRDWSTVMANQIWVADHRQFDMWIRTFDEGKQEWVPVRPWICAFVDAKSWHLIAAQIVVDNPNNATIRKTLVDGIKAFGVPAGIYSDNGKDFLAQGFAEPVKFTLDESNPEIYAHSILAELGIRVIKSLPYRGRSKLVERFFGEVSRSFDRLFGSYLGNAPQARPDSAHLYSKSQEMTMRLPSLQQFCDIFDAWLREYHNTPMDGKILAGMTPEQAFSPEKRYAKAPISEARLFYATLKPLPRLHTVARGPSVFFGKQEFRAVDQEALWPYFERKVMVKIDAFDPEHVFAYTVDGRLICECKTKPQVAAIDGDVGPEMRLQSQQKRTCKTLVWNLAGGFQNLSPLRVAALTGDELAHPERLKVIDAVSSVKGPSHLRRHLELPGDAPMATDMQPVPFREDMKKAELAKFEQTIKGESEPKVSHQELREFNAFMTTRRNNEDDGNE